MGKNFVSRCEKACEIKCGIPQMGNAKRKKKESRAKEKRAERERERERERLHFARYSWGRVPGRREKERAFWSISKTFPFFMISFDSRTLLSFRVHHDIVSVRRGISTNWKRSSRTEDSDWGIQEWIGLLDRVWYSIVWTTQWRQYERYLLGHKVKYLKPDSM